MKWMTQFAKQPYRDYLSIVCAMTRKDMLILKSKIFDLIINAIIILAIELLIWSKIYPQLGMSVDFIVPMFAGWPLVSLMLHLGFCFSTKYTLGALYTGYGFMEYDLTLPIPTMCILAQYIISFWIESCIVTIPLLLLGLTVLSYMGFAFSGSIMAVTLFYMIALLLCGVSFLAASFWYSNQWFEDNFWPRRISFLVTVGATFYPWYKVLAYSKFTAIVMLLNPLTYVCEGMRSILVGGPDYITWWVCLLMLGICTIVASWWMVHSVRKKLDLILGKDNNMQTYIRAVKIIKMFFWRDCLVHLQSLANDCVNYGILWPITFGFSFVVLRKNILFSAATVDASFGAMVLAGSVVLPMMIIAYKITFDLLFDLESRKYVTYQLGILNPKLVLLQRLLFATCYTFFISMLLFPAGKLFLGKAFVIANPAWFTVAGILLLSSLATCAYHQVCAIRFTIQSIETFWIRINGVLMNLGGTFIPTTLLLKLPFIGKLIFLNPVLHMTEAVRGVLYPGSTIIPVHVCCLYLVGITILCIVLSWISFKKRVDHI